MRRTHLITIGACAIDTILTVPHLPPEDSKLRAVSLAKRRGGNTPNTLEVLQQLVCHKHGLTQHTTTQPQLTLIATLPANSSPAIPIIRDSLRQVDISRCIHREDHDEPVSSYIVSSQATGSRTIINHNELPEMTFEEFKDIADDVLAETSGQSRRDHPADASGSDGEDLLWFHFEGRLPETTRRCMEYLKTHPGCASGEGAVQPKVQLKISVELEKPGREGLQALAHLAHVVFYSRSWAEGEGYQDASTLLKEQAVILRSGSRSRGTRTLVCTWGDQGSWGLRLPEEGGEGEMDVDRQIVKGEPFTMAGRGVVDAVGAGDTFIAGMLFGYLCRDGREPDGGEPGIDWSLEQKLMFANVLAGRKVFQNGFARAEGAGRGLGEESRLRE